MQNSAQPFTTIAEMDGGDRNFKSYLMVVGREFCNDKWQPRSQGGIRPPGHLVLMDKENNYVRMTIWSSTFAPEGLRRSQNVDYWPEVNKFLDHFVLGATYEFSGLVSKDVKEQYVTTKAMCI